ncbi:ribosomal protein L17, putative [Eimeria acervulina]|uniref:Ribosomal protein L17, putative n=1 Tax=Eimeria acervulina TaxID=5801 RepID=U6GEL4_EIMAC|nr:ribosomal protein L17, putative [Eimeria acervulina]CDI77987.1 ribosomal protein L17, putative [Eimeria acervulina]
MGFGSTFKLLNLGIKRRTWRRTKKQPQHRWDAIRNQLDQLLRYGRLETTITRAKELQPYAEELIQLAKRPEKALAVESVLRTPAARRRLFEEYVGVYRHRNFFFTRVVNQFMLRLRDAAPMAYIEFVDRPGELRPAQPVGVERQKYLWQQMQQSRRQRRLLWNHAVKIGLSNELGFLLKPQIFSTEQTKDEAKPARCIGNDFFVDLPPPNLRERRAKARPRRFYP